MSHSNAAKTYKAQAVLNAPRLKIVQMLYGEAVSTIRRGIKHLEEGKEIPYRKDLVKAQSIVTELFASLDYEKGLHIADNLASLYQFCITSILEASVNKSLGSLNGVLKVLATLEAGWRSIKDEEDPSGS